MINRKIDKEFERFHEQGRKEALLIDGARQVRAVPDASLNLADSFVILTGDSDQIGTVLSIRKDFGKQVLVFNPHESNSLELKMAATFYRSIPRDLPARCQFPTEIQAGKKGKVIRRPSGW